MNILTSPLYWTARTLYSAVMRVRNVGYDRGILYTSRATLPVISIGNITAGGNGKTPLAIFLVRALQSRGYHPAVLSRGYGRTTRGVREVSNDDRPDRCGDEPLLIRRATGVPVYVAERRVVGARAIESRGDSDVIVLDDGLQHRALHRDVNIVAIGLSGEEDVREFCAGRLLPEGRFREDRDSALARTDIAILFNRAGPAPAESDLSALRTRMPTSVTIFRGGMVSRGVRSLESGAPLPPQAVAVFSGVARPEGFHRTLLSLGFSIAGVQSFPDHHPFSASEIDHLRRAYPGLPLVCTEKDAVKLDLLSDRIGVHVLSVEAQVTPADAFIVAVERKLRERR
jgi:tetraacyldisaccharide 4'-kinase